MPTTLTVDGELLTASLDDRVLTYRLLPYGEAGRTSAGVVTASRGTVTVPDDVASLVANLEHDRTRPVARFVSVDETDDGLTASLRVLRTTAGDDLLVEASEGVRTGISVELNGATIRAGQLTAGALTGAGFCTRPAFPSAQLVAADTDPVDVTAAEVPDDDLATIRTAAQTITDTLARTLERDETTDPTDTPADAEATHQEDTMPEQVTASAPADLTASRAQRPAGPSSRDVAELLAAAHATNDPGVLRAITELGSTQLFAALSDIKYDSTGAAGINITQPEWLGKLWQGRRYQRRFMTLFGAIQPLRALEVKGWRWGTAPAGGAWAGNKTAVPSNAPTTVPYTKKANRWAGGHDIAREYSDFPNPEFWEAYFNAMGDDYAEYSDLTFLDEVIAAATPIEVGIVPTGVPEGLVKIVDGALAVVEKGAPAFAVMGKALWRDFILTPKDETLEYLSSSLGLEDGQLAGFRVLPAPSTSDLTDTQVLVGAREAAEARELPGASPLRVEAQNLVNGGVDNAFFGYFTSVIHAPEAIVLVDDADED